MKQASFIIKATTKCTLACKYCSYMPFTNSQETMDYNILEQSIRKILSLPVEKVTFIWHGGEPLLTGLDFYREAIKLQEIHKTKKQQIRNNIQTNGTLLNVEWIDFFKNNKFNVGISIDGPSRVHDNNRTYATNKGSSFRVNKGIKLAQEHNLKQGYLSVITEDSVGKAKEMFYYFLENNIKAIDFLPCVDFRANDHNGLTISPESYAQFLIDYFDVWFRYDDPEIRIRFFENTLKGILGGKPTLCKFAGTCANFTTINYNGDIFPCDKFLGTPTLRFGNIVEDDLKSIFKLNKHKEFVNSTAKLNSECISCKWLPICNGGCTYYRYMRNRLFSDISYFCESNKQVFAHIEKVIKQQIN